MSVFINARVGQQQRINSGIAATTARTQPEVAQPSFNRSRSQLLVALSTDGVVPDIILDATAAILFGSNADASVLIQANASAVVAFSSNASVNVLVQLGATAPIAFGSNASLTALIVAVATGAVPFGSVAAVAVLVQANALALIQFGSNSTIITIAPVTGGLLIIHLPHHHGDTNVYIPA